MGLALYEVDAFQNHDQRRKKMKISKIKKALSLVLILSLVGAWFHVNVCGAEEGQQRFPDGVEQAVKDSTSEGVSDLNSPPPVKERMAEKGGLEKQLEGFVRGFVLPWVLIPVIVGLSAGFMVIYAVTGDKRFNPIPK